MFGEDNAPLSVGLQVQRNMGEKSSMDKLVEVSCGLRVHISCFVASHPAWRPQCRQLQLDWKDHGKLCPRNPREL